MNGTQIMNYPAAFCIRFVSDSCFLNFKEQCFLKTIYKMNSLGNLGKNLSFFINEMG